MGPSKRTARSTALTAALLAVPLALWSPGPAHAAGALGISGPAVVRAVQQAQEAAPTVAPAAVSPVQNRARIAVRFALAQRGKPYVYGASGPHSYDCSGLVKAAWRYAGISLPRTSYAQLRSGHRVALNRLQPGDIVGYFHGSHVALYAGHGKVVGAENPRTGIVLIPLNWGRQQAQWAVRPVWQAVRPDPADAKLASSEAAGMIASGKSVRVKSGDSLSAIAQRYHVPGGWREVYDRNRSIVGPNPGLIYPGQTLVL